MKEVDTVSRSSKRERGLKWSLLINWMGRGVSLSGCRIRVCTGFWLNIRHTTQTESGKLSLIKTK